MFRLFLNTYEYLLLRLRIIMMELFGINLTAGRVRYVQGDVVSGEIVVQYNKTKTINELSVSIIGECHVEWRKGRVKYQDTETYFNVQHNILDMTSSESERITSSGVPYVKYFELDVPRGGFPPSFESDVDYVRYYVILKVRAQGERELVTTRPFQIILSASSRSCADADVETARSRDVRKSALYSLSRQSLHVRMAENSEDRGVINICFRAKPELFQTQPSLIQKTTYTIMESEISKYRSIDCECTSTLDENSNDDVTAIALTIPKKSFPIMHHCGLISIQYFIKSPVSILGERLIPLKLQRGPELVFIERPP